MPKPTYEIAVLRQYDPLDSKFEDGDELWIIQAIPSGNVLPIGSARIDCTWTQRPLIHHVYVDRERRHAGVGTSLVEKAVQRWGLMDITGPTSEKGQDFLRALRDHSEIGPLLGDEW